MDNMDIDWLEGKYPPSVDEIIERRAGEFLAEIHAMAEEAKPVPPIVELNNHLGLLQQLLQNIAYPTDHQLAMMANQRNAANQMAAFQQYPWNPPCHNTISNIFGW